MNCVEDKGDKCCTWQKIHLHSGWESGEPFVNKASDLAVQKDKRQLIDTSKPSNSTICMFAPPSTGLHTPEALQKKSHLFLSSSPANKVVAGVDMYKIQLLKVKV